MNTLINDAFRFRARLRPCDRKLPANARNPERVMI